MQIRPSSIVRAAGAALATAVSGRAPRTARAAVLAASDLTAHRIDPVGLQPLAINPAADLNVLVSTASEPLTTGTGTASWVALNLLVDAGARSARLPALLRATAIGVAVYAADVAVARAHEQGRLGARPA